MSRFFSGPLRAYIGYIKKPKHMFDQILNLVKEQLSSDPKVAAAIPADKADAIHNEVAQQVTNGLAGQAGSGGFGGLLDMLKGGLASGSPVTGAISGGLVNSLAAKFGLSPAIAGAIAGALPGILQKFLNKAEDPNDDSVTETSFTDSLSKLGGGGLGDIAGKLGGLFK